MDIGLKIKEARKNQGLSQQQLGGNDFTKGYISQIEQGRVIPSMKVLTVISEKLKLPISYFLNEETVNSKEIQDKFISGENLFLKKRYEDAYNIFKDITCMKCDTKSSFYCIALLYEGKCQFFLKNYLKSMDILCIALESIKDINLYEELFDCHNFLGHCNFNLYNFKAAIDKFQDAYNIMETMELNLPDKKANLLLNIGTAYSNMGNFKRALEYFNSNIAHCKQNYILETLLDCYTRMGYCSYKIKKYDFAKEYLSLAESINKSLDSKMVMTEINFILALILGNEGNFHEGFNLLSEGIETSSKIKYEFGHNISIAYWTYLLILSGEINKAEKYALCHLKKLEAAEDKLPFFLLLGYIGDISIKQGELEKCRQYLKKAIKGFADICSYYEASYYSKLLAEMLMEKYPSESKNYYNLSIEYISKMM